MATIPSHLNFDPSDFQQARQGGASAGVAVAGGQRAGAAQASQARQAQARMAQESQLANQRIALAQQQLTQQQILAEMEAQTRKEIAQQNHLKQQQEIEVQKAYQTSRLGLEAQRIKQAEAVNNARARDAAMRFSAQQDFSSRMFRGESVDKALYANPGLVTPSTISAVTSATRPRAATISPETKVRDEALKTDIDEIVRQLRDPYGAMDPADKEKLKQERKSLEQQRAELAGGRAPASTSTGTGGEEIIRFTKDGRRAVFDAGTRKFIRFVE